MIPVNSAKRIITKVVNQVSSCFVSFEALKMTKVVVTESKVKPPTWNGKKSKWQFYETKMKAYLAQKGYADLLHWKSTIPVDDTESTKVTDPTAIRIRTMNQEAFSILLNSIDVSTLHGEYAFDMVEKFITEEHSGGDFKKAWEALVKFNDHKDSVAAHDFEQQYFDMKMDEEDYPPSFIMKLDQKRKKMNKNIDETRKVDEKTMIKHVLGKLPKGEDGQVGPYQAHRSIIEEKIKANSDYSIDDLTMDLLTVYNAMHPDDSDSEEETTGKKSASKSKGEIGLATFGCQIKKKCNHCGKWGHIAKFCKEKKSNSSNQEN